MSASDQLELRITADGPVCLADASRQLRAFLEQHRVGERARYAADLALEELGTNILGYGFAEGAAAAFRFCVSVDPDQIELVFEDDGRAFDPTAAPTPRRPPALEETALGGLGIHMVRQVVAQLHYCRLQQRNRLVVQITNAA